MRCLKFALCDRMMKAKTWHLLPQTHSYNNNSHSQSRMASVAMRMLEHLTNPPWSVVQVSNLCKGPENLTLSVFFSGPKNLPISSFSTAPNNLTVGVLFSTGYRLNGPV